MSVVFVILYNLHLWNHALLSVLVSVLQKTKTNGVWVSECIEKEKEGWRKERYFKEFT